jgi:FkbM family methyltransferase
MRWHNSKIDFEPLKEYVDPETIVDIGAYIGYTAKAFMKTFPKARVIAIEPVEESFEILTKALGDNDDWHCLAIGASKGKLKLSSPFEEFQAFPFSGMSAVTGRGYRERTVEMLPLTDLVESAEILKIHVQGYVKEVVEGAMPIIESCHPVLVIEDHISIEDVLALLPEYKYAEKIAWMKVYI